MQSGIIQKYSFYGYFFIDLKLRVEVFHSVMEEFSHGLLYFSRTSDITIKGVFSA